MVTYNFHPDQARDIIFGLKASALKPPGKRPHVAVGGMVHAFCGAVPPDYTKSPDCHRLITAPCVRSDAITIDEPGAIVAGLRVENAAWYDTVAVQEGFADFSALQAHYARTYGLPWSGHLIRWAPHKAEFRAQWPLIVKPPEEDRDDTE